MAQYKVDGCLRLLSHVVSSVCPQLVPVPRWSLSNARERGEDTTDTPTVIFFFVPFVVLIFSCKASYFKIKFPDVLRLQSEATSKSSLWDDLALELWKFSNRNKMVCRLRFLTLTGCGVHSFWQFLVQTFSSRRFSPEQSGFCFVLFFCCLPVESSNFLIQFDCVREGSFLTHTWPAQ